MKNNLENNKTVKIAMIFLLFISSCHKEAERSILQPANSLFTLTTSAVSNGELLDAYKCERKVNGVENSIPLTWSNPPANANSFAITMIHYPFPGDSSQVNSYLLLWGIDKSVTGIPYGQADKGPWFMGCNKDGVTISYTSPCSPSSGSHQYIMTIYALSATPSSLPTRSSLSVNYAILMDALSTVTIIDKATLIFNSVTP